MRDFDFTKEDAVPFTDAELIQFAREIARDILNRYDYPASSLIIQVLADRFENAVSHD